MHCLGSTENVMVIGDKQKKLTLLTDSSSDHIVPAIIYDSGKDPAFFRLIYSAQELDETFLESDEPVVINVKLSLKIDYEIK